MFRLFENKLFEWKESGMNKPKYAIRISAKNFGFENNIKSIPLYATFLI